VLEHERTLEIAGAVQTGGELEMSFEEGADTAKQVQHLG
jgi:hypothetical protein